MAGEQFVAVDKNDVHLLQCLAGDDGVEEIPLDKHTLEPVTTVAFARLGTAPAAGTVSHLIERDKRGRIIDLRPDAPTALLPSQHAICGLSVVLAHGCDATVDAKQPEGIFRTVAEAMQHVITQAGEAGNRAIGSASQQEVVENIQVAVQAAFRATSTLE